MIEFEKGNTTTIPEGYSELKELPSKFLPYDVNVLYVKPFSMGEVEQLAEMKTFELKKFLSIIKDIVHNVNVMDLAVLDLKVTLVYALILSEDSEGWSLSNQCEHCGTIFKTKLKVDMLEFIDTNLTALPITTTISKLENVTFDILRMKHLIGINEFLSKFTSDKSFNNKLLTLAFVSSLEDKESAYKLLYNLPITTNNQEEINSLSSNIVQGIKPLKVTCPNNILYLTIPDEEQGVALLGEFKSVQLLNNRYYIPNDNEVKLQIIKFIEDKEFKYTKNICGHKQDRSVDLDFSHLFP